MLPLAPPVGAHVQVAGGLVRGGLPDADAVGAAGHDLSAPGGMTATLDGMEAAVGPGRLALVHANDSLDACGSRRDRHTTIGEGAITASPYGCGPFAELLAHPSVTGPASQVAVVVETPSVRDGSPTAGHARDIALLRSLAPV